MQVAPNVSAQGMRRAKDRLAEAAVAIATPAQGAARAADPSPAPPAGNQGLTAAQAIGELERALADSILARRAYETNAKAFERNAEIERALLNRGA